jgi:hypothetical protein
LDFIQFQIYSFLLKDDAAFVQYDNTITQLQGALKLVGGEKDCSTPGGMLC